MKAKDKIRNALETIMTKGEANACRVYKGFDYNGVQQASGWFYSFGKNPQYLGKNLQEALDEIEACASAREMM